MTVTATAGIIPRPGHWRPADAHPLVAHCLNTPSTTGTAWIASCGTPITDTTSEAAPCSGMTWCPRCLQQQGLLAVGAHLERWPATPQDLASSILLPLPLSPDTPDDLDPEEYDPAPEFRHINKPTCTAAAELQQLYDTTWETVWRPLVGMIIALRDQTHPAAVTATIRLRQALASYELVMIAGFDAAITTLRTTAAAAAAQSTENSPQPTSLHPADADAGPTRDDTPPEGQR